MEPRKVVVPAAPSLRSIPPASEDDQQDSEDENEEASEELSPDSQDLFGTQDPDASHIESHPDSSLAATEPESQPNIHTRTQEANHLAGASACENLSLQFICIMLYGHASFCYGYLMAAAILGGCELEAFPSLEYEQPTVFFHTPTVRVPTTARPSRIGPDQWPSSWTI